MAVIQFLPSFTLGDAIGNYTLYLHNIINSWGTESRIMCQYFSSNTVGRALYYKKYPQIKNDDDIIIYHFSIGADMTDYILELPQKKIMIYHNITPPEYFRDYSPFLYEEVKKGRKELLKLRGKFDLYLSDSDYNKQELDNAGFRNSHVLPLTIDWEELFNDGSSMVYDRIFRDGKTNILFTGKVSPQKRIEDLIKVFYFYKKSINYNSRLIIMGQKEGLFSHYYLNILKMISSLGLDDIVFTGWIDQRQWTAIYKSAHIFLSLSAHEGFCAPVMEAMVAGVPVISVPDCALEGTLGYGGILINERDYVATAFLIDKIIRDKPLREKIIENQHKWFTEYKNKNISKMLKNFIDGLYLYEN